MARGHTLVIPRKHRTKLSDLSLPESQALGTWLPLISRAVMRAVDPTAPEYGDWNVVQNNGTLCSD